MAQPCVSDVRSGSTSIPIGSRATCGAGLSVTWPPWYAVGSPRRHATSACIASCTVVENRNAANHTNAVAKSISTASVRYRLGKDASLGASGAGVQEAGALQPVRIGIVGKDDAAAANRV